MCKPRQLGARVGWVNAEITPIISDGTFTLGGQITVSSYIQASSVTFDSPTTVNSGTENSGPAFYPLTVSGDITTNANVTIVGIYRGKTLPRTLWPFE